MHYIDYNALNPFLFPLNTEAAINIGVGSEAQQHHNYCPEQLAPSAPPPPCYLQHGQLCVRKRGHSGTVKGKSPRFRAKAFLFDELPSNTQVK